MRWAALACALLWACDTPNLVDDNDFYCESDGQCATGYVCDLPRNTCARLHDGGAPDGEPGDGEPGDGQPHDAAVSPSDQGPDEGLADGDVGPRPPCNYDDLVEPPPAGDGTLRLGNTVVSARYDVGGPPGKGALLAGNLDGDPGGSVEIAALRGGRIEVRSDDGRLWWRTAVDGYQGLSAVVDLDGDGRLEIVAYTAHRAFVLDARTGQVRWSLPDRPFGPDLPDASGVGKVLVGDVDGDRRPDLYVAEGGCGGAGEGFGAFFGFGEGFPGRALGVIRGPRRGGPCAAYQTLADVDGDDRVELIVPDGSGASAFDPLTGARRYCGVAPAGPGGVFAHHVADVDGDGRDELVTVFENQIAVVALGEGEASPACPDGGAQLLARWTRTLGDAVRFTGSALHDLDGDGWLDVVASYREGGSWRVVFLDGHDGQTLLGLPDRLLVGTPDLNGDGVPELLTAVDAAATPATYGELQLFALDGQNLPSSRWRLEHTAAVRAPGRATATRRSPGDEPVATLGDRVLVLRAGVRPAERLEVVAIDGASSAWPMEGEPGAMTVTCRAPDGCDPGDAVLALALADGHVALLDAALALTNDAGGGVPTVAVPTGVGAVVGVPDGAGVMPVVLTPSGELIALDARAEGHLRWRRALGGTDGGATRPPTAPVVLRLADGASARLLVSDRRDSTVHDSTVIDSQTGETVWHHALPDGPYRDISPAVGLDVNGDGHDDVVRYDVLREPDALEPAPKCERDLRSDPRGLAPDPDCPGTVRGRVVTALDGLDGACLWRMVIRPHVPCAGGTIQWLSVADGDGDGAPELYVTETDAVRRIDPRTGEILATGVNGRYPSAARSGGRILATATEPGLLRAGGNGPVAALTFDLERVWREPDDLSPSPLTWYRRFGAVVGRRDLWISAGPGLPIRRLAIGEANDGARLRGEVALSQGRAVDPRGPMADLISFHPRPALGPEQAPGVLVRADDGYLYALDTEGALLWSRAFGSAYSEPLIADLDADGADELAVAVGDGTLVIADHPDLPPPPQAWDTDCGGATCDPDDDIDLTRSTTELCAEWVPVAGAEGYEVRVVGPNDAEIDPWREVGPTTYTHIGLLQLVPGVHYQVEIRAWRRVGDDRIGYSEVARTDGVTVINDSAPEVTVTLSAVRFNPGEAPLTIDVEARDDLLLAGWRLEVFPAEGDASRILAVGPLAHREFTARREWDAQDGDKRPAPPGRYRVRATFVDQAGNVGSDEATTEICDGPC